MYTTYCYGQQTHWHDFWINSYFLVVRLWPWNIWFQQTTGLFLYITESHCDLASYDIFSPQSVTLCAFAYSLAMSFTGLFLSKKKKKRPYFHRTFSPSPELLYISNIHVIQLIDKGIQYIRASHSVSYLNWIKYFPIVCNNYCALRMSILRLLLWFHSSIMEDKNQNPWDTGSIEVKLRVLK